jgi:hypothetical protein
LEAFGHGDRGRAEGLPERGTLVVAVGHDGTLSAAAERVDQASGGLVRRALERAGGEAKHGRVVDLFLPAGLQLDRLLVVRVGKKGGLKRTDLEELGGALVGALRSLRVTRRRWPDSTGWSCRSRRPRPRRR